MTQDQTIEHYATTLVRIAQTMKANCNDEDKVVSSEQHGFDLEAMDQYADMVSAVATMLRMHNRYNRGRRL